MRAMRIAIVAAVVEAGIALAGLPAAAATGVATGHVARAAAVSPSTCPPRNSPGFCGG